MSLVLRKFWIVCSIILVLSLPAGATSMGEVEDNIIKKCEAEARNPFTGSRDASAFYYCSLEQLITFKKVMGYYRDFGNRSVLDKIIEKHWSMRYGTSDWPKVLEEYEDKD